MTEDKSEPAPLTDDDVKAMARGNPTSVTRRIARHSPSGRTGKLTGEKATPAPISAAEMARIRRARGLPKALRERLGGAGEPDGADESVASAKRSPTRAPDRGTR